MAMHPEFGDWYRSAGVTIPEGLLEKRWAGVEDVVKQPTAALVLSLAKLFTLPNVKESAVPDGFREFFRKHDEDNFPSRDNLQELRVLAGAALRVIIDQWKGCSPLAALALACRSFGPREVALPEQKHLDVAQRFLVEYSRATRECPPPEAIKIPSFTKEKLGETLPQNLFAAANQIPQIYDPLLNTLTTIASGWSSALTQAQNAIGQITHTASVREEEVAILWWLQSHFSRDLQKPFSEIGYTAGTLVFPMELADLTVFVPGSEAAIAVLAYALQLAGSPSSSEEVTIANVTNATPPEWREKVCERHALDSSGLLTPILLAIHKSLETDGHDEWLPVYRKACDIPINKPFPLIQLSLQLLRERMLLRAAVEAK